jgi:hypothetical protein
MNIPAFTAQASLYRTSNLYRAFGDFGGSIADESVVAAYIPGPATRQRCSDCTYACEAERNTCLLKVAAAAAEGCILSGSPWGCVLSAIDHIGEAADCYIPYETCRGYCHIPGPDSRCCPKLCAFSPFKDGTGCCDLDEACLGSDHPNTRDGCCPVGQYCGGNCCATGESCCGDKCCPAGYSCIDGICTTGFPNTPPPPPPESGCYLFAGGSPCGTKCCYNYLQCCGYTPEFGPDCRTSCPR